ncbi:MAG TPA: SAM-dependent methyltransferase [Deltaproteobacteria bacterium]|jgi:hypothetical protein|nr:SAM-dependent methyltransferase [Candidatus Lambdaproteobacteria bacterium]HIL16143.1 SAM-dependent methyltransferase [Deltaproteobacteria bacterium]
MARQTSAAQHITMSGGGAYSLATKGAGDVITLAADLVLNAVEAMKLPPELPVFQMLDMGCADGGTSLGMIGKVIERVEKTCPDAVFNIIYTDQPRNDFNALVQMIHGLGPFESYLERFQNVRPLFSASSFYLPICPPNSVNLGFSATAMHWLRQKPCDLENHVHMVGATGDALVKFAEQGKRDWERILLNRSKELVSGGRLVLVNFGRDEEGRYLGNTFGVNMFDTFNEIWNEFLENGRISREEYVRMTLPQYYNTVEEFSAPLTDPASPVYQSGLRLVDVHTRIVPCPFAEEFKTHGNVKRFANAYIPTIRSWNQSIFLGALDESRPLEERQELIESYYGTYHQRVLDAPEGHGMDYVHAYLIVEKI